MATKRTNDEVQEQPRGNTHDGELAATDEMGEFVPRVVATNTPKEPVKMPAIVGSTFAERAQANAKVVQTGDAVSK